MKIHPNPIWNNEALGFFEHEMVAPTRKEQEQQDEQPY